MRRNAFIKTISIPVIMLLFFIVFSEDSSAAVGGIDGKVFMKYQGHNIEMPGVRIYREDGNYDYLTLTEKQSCPVHVRNHMISGIEWKTFKYNCSRDIPQTFNDVTYNSTQCRDLCKYRNECLYEKSPGVFVCDQTGTQRDSSCKTKCYEDGAQCRQFVDVPSTIPPLPTESEVQDNIRLICRADRGGVETTTNNSGFYTMGPSVKPPINNPGPFDPKTYQLWGSALCPTGSMGSVSMKGGDYEKLGYCGLNCLENAHKIKAYLSSDTINWLKSKYSSIPIDESDPKGGGHWEIRQSGGYYFRTHLEKSSYFISYADAKGTGDWDGYKATEWYNLLLGNDQVISGFHFYWIPPNEPKPPDITVIPQKVSPWIGTETVNDNGPSCQDYNPYTFKMQATDPDGSKDINRLEFSLAGTGQLGYTDVRWWPLRLMFARNYSGQPENMFFARDKVVKTKGTEYCFDKDRNRVQMKGSSDLYCFSVDAHSKQQGKPTTMTLNGKTADVYYIENDIFVFNEGYSYKLLGSKNEGGWQGNTYVAYQQNGDVVEAQFRVQFEGDQSDPWTGEYHNMWRVEDMTQLEDPTYNIPGEQAHRTDPTTHHRLSMTRLDFIPPTVKLYDPIDAGGSSIDVPWTAEDTGGSLLNEVWGEAEHSEGKDATEVLNTTRNINYNPWKKEDGGDYNTGTFEYKYLWSETGINNGIYPTPSGTKSFENVDLLANNEGTLFFYGGAVDNACNMSDNLGSSKYVSFRPWLLTRAGLVFSGGLMNLSVQNLSGDTNLCPGGGGCSSFDKYPYNFPRYDVALSTELLSSGGSIHSDNLINQNSAKTYPLPNYGTERNNRLWYNDLYTRAEFNLKNHSSRYHHQTNIGSLEGNLSNSRCNFPGNSKLCVLETNGGIVVDKPVVCDKETIIFVKGLLEIKQPITSGSGSYGCIFVTTGDVTIDTQNSTEYTTAYSQYDSLGLYVVSDGQIIIKDSEKGYGVQVWGGLLGFGQNQGSSFFMDRSLKNGLNSDYPTYILHHDPRYFGIARKLFAPDKDTYKHEIGDKPN